LQLSESNESSELSDESERQDRLNLRHKLVDAVVEKIDPKSDLDGKQNLI